MSNLFKSGLTGINQITTEPLILDMNPLAEAKERQNRIVRSLSEQAPPEETPKDGPGEKPASEENSAVFAEAVDQANRLRDDAAKQAEEIVKNALAEADAIREDARKEGFEKGLAEGNREASKKAEVYLANLQKENEMVLAAKQEEEEAYLRDAEQKMVDITCQLIEKLTGILVRDYQPVLLYMINSAMNEEDTGKHYVIRVSESSYPYINDNRERIAKAGNPSVTIEIFGDAKLEPHQCMIESDNGIIDLSMDLQAKNLITAIKLLSE